jgi:hypoxanthine phosphoribosyltransferase
MSTLKTVYSREDIKQRVEALGREISERYRSVSEPVVAVCVLKGAFIFFADLVRSLDFDPELDFVRLASYGQETVSQGRVLFSKDMEVNIQGKHVLIVEDIIDTGYTAQFLTRVLQARNPLSVAFCTLVDKASRREVDVKIDFVGFSLAGGFIVGYGLDYAEQYRQLSSICELTS